MPPRTESQPHVERDIVLRASSGNLAIIDTSEEVDSSGYEKAIVALHVEALVMADADDEVDFYVQTELDGNWVDVANVHFSNGDEPIATAERLIKIGPMATGVSSFTPTDTTLADNTTVALPVGAAIRIKTKLTGATAPTYAYSAKVSLYG